MPRLICCLLCLSFAAALAGTGPDRYSPDRLRADFSELRDRLYASHVDPFAGRTRESMDREFERLADRIDAPMTKGEAALLFQRFVAFGNVAHARVEDAGVAFAEHLERDGPIVPFDVRVVNGRMHVSDVYPGGEPLKPGDALMRIAGRGAGELRDAMHRELSADNEYLADTLLELEFPRVLWQVIGGPDRYAVRVARGDEILDLTLVAGRASTRRSVGPGRRLALSWTEREADMRACDTAYLRPGPFYQPEGAMWDTTAFHAFIDRAFESFARAGAERLVIDLRNNPGGDVAFSDHLLAWFADERFRFYSRFEVRNSAAAQAGNARRLEADDPSESSKAYAAAYEQYPEGSVFEHHWPWVEPREGERFDGEVYVLVNRHSYSNAVTMTAIVQDYGFGTVIGEPTADLATTLGAMEQFELTHSGLRVGFPKARIVRPNGDERRLGVEPDIRIRTPIVEPAGDPVLAEALRIACGDSSRAD